MMEKVRGKRAAANELAQKKRKMAAAVPLKRGGISLGGDRTTRPRRTAVLEWSDDNEDPVAPPPSVQETEIPAEQATGVPEQQAEINPERRGEETPEQ